jgi:hypothetical protein
MILDQIDELIRFVQIKTACNTSFGDPVLSTDDLPHITLKPIESISIDVMSKNDLQVQFPVKCTITTQRNEERTAIMLLEKLLRSLPDFNCHEGNIIQSSGSCSYTDNSFQITIDYSLKAITGD